MVNANSIAVPSAVGTTVVDAIEINQSGHRIFVASLTGEQLIGLSVVDPYNSSLPPGDPKQGYQRPAERSRITRIGTYLIKHQGSGLYPNAILLGARNPLRFDPVTHRLELPAGSSLRVIDGQHRIEGLRYAIEEKDADSLRHFPIPVVIVQIEDRTVEMDQFKIINGTAKSVRVDLVNSILTAIFEEQGADAIPEKELWKVVVTKAVDALNKRDDSPWQDVLLMPDETTVASNPGKITRATSVITSIRPIYDYLQEFGFLSQKNVEERAAYLTDILVAYWRALRNVVPDAFTVPADYVIQKTPGLFSLHYLLKDKLLKDIYFGRRPWDEETFEEFIGDSPEITEAAFWHKNNKRAAAYGSMKGFRELADLLIDSVAQ